MPTAVLNLFAGQCNGRTDRQNGNCMLPLLGEIKKKTTLSLKGSEWGSQC